MQVIKSIQPVCLRLQFPYMCCAGNLIFRRVKSSKNRHPSLGMLAAHNSKKLSMLLEIAEGNRPS